MSTTFIPGLRIGRVLSALTTSLLQTKSSSKGKQWYISQMPFRTSSAASALRVQGGHVTAFGPTPATRRYLVGIRKRIGSGAFRGRFSQALAIGCYPCCANYLITPIMCWNRRPPLCSPISWTLYVLISFRVLRYCAL